MNNWFSDNGNGTFTNPILYTDYSDPDVIRVGDDYFMTASSFCNTPGLPVLHSRDLVNWSVISYALENIPYDRYEMPQHGCGVWAPAIRYRAGEFIIFFPMPDEGIFVVKTKDPWGSWSKPITLFEGAGWIDPCPFWDEDGRAYMVNAFAKSRIGFKSVLQMVEISPDCTKMIGDPVRIFDGNLHEQETIEGPKLYKRNGYYYIFAPAGGVKQGWQVVLRSRDIYGPYEYQIVCEQKDTRVNGPHQGGWIDTPAGEDWFIHFQDVYAAGRIVHLQPMKWVNDWPVIGVADDGDTCGKPVSICNKPVVVGNGEESTCSACDSGLDKQYEVQDRLCEYRDSTYQIWAPCVSDDFSRGTIGLQWQWNANHNESFYEIKEASKGQRGRLFLHSIPKQASISGQPNLFLQKWAAPEFTATAVCDLSGMEVDDLAGMIHMGVKYAALAVRKRSEHVELVSVMGEQTFHKEVATGNDTCQVVCGDLSKIGFNSLIYFRYTVVSIPSTEVNLEGKYAFDIPSEMVVLSYSIDGHQFIPAISIEAKAGRWVGAKEGMFICNEAGRMGGSMQLLDFKVN